MDEYQEALSLAHETVRNRRHIHQNAGSAANSIPAEVTSLSACPPLVCDPDLTREMVGYMSEMDVPGMTPVPGVHESASEDFSFVAQRVPSTFMYLSAGYEDERGEHPAHNPRVRFNEEVLPIGAACLTYCAAGWLENNR